MKCQQCGGRAQLPLCKTCTGQLGGMLDDLGWLLHELEITAARQDKLTVGTLPAGVVHPSPINVGAIELLRSIGGQLRWLVGGFFNNDLPVAAQPRLMVWMLRRDLDKLAWRSDAETCYRTIQRLVGPTGHGPIHDTINRCDRRFAGDCPDCGVLLYAREEDIYTTCPACEMPVDVDKNQTRALAEYDLLPERALLNVLDNLREHVPRVTLYGWITTGKLPVAGYLSSDGVVARKGGPRDPRVYSLNRARTLRRREQTPQLALAPH